MPQPDVTVYPVPPDDSKDDRRGQERTFSWKLQIKE